MTLDDDNFICRPDSLGSKTEESGLTLLNLQILNTDWYEVKETFALHDHQYGNNCEDDYGSDNHGALLPLGYHIAVYVTKGINSEAMLQAIEPGASYLDKSPKDIICRVITINQTSDTSLHHYCMEGRLQTLETTSSTLWCLPCQK